MSLANNIEFLRRLPKLNGINGFGGFARVPRRRRSSPLVETSDSAAIPAISGCFRSPDDQRARQKSALVVVLHGCAQTAAGYDIGAGWSTLAERYGFALLMPEQKASNNANGCFNWFNPEDTTRDSGEACSIRQMIARMARDHSIDPDRIFVTGLSAGGAMTSVMLATYPEIFAGGAIIAGLPYGVASNVRQALSGMYQSASRPAARTRRSRAKRIVAQGTVAETVGVARQRRSHRQSGQCRRDRQAMARRARSAAGADVATHGRRLSPRRSGGMRTARPWSNPTPSPIWPTAPRSAIADNDERYGAEGAFLIEAGISSSYHIASFFGLTERVHQPSAASKPVEAAATPATMTVAAAAFPPPPAPELDRNALADSRVTQPSQVTPSRRGVAAIDVGAVITRALTAAGLMK